MTWRCYCGDCPSEAYKTSCQEIVTANNQTRCSQEIPNFRTACPEPEGSGGSSSSSSSDGGASSTAGSGGTTSTGGSGECADDTVCVPEDADCLLFTGDVACPASLVKSLVYAPSAATQCTCTCGPGEQHCPNKDIRTFVEPGCSDGDKIEPLGNGLCQDTGFNGIESVENKDATINADATGCENTSGPLTVGSMSQTLCCP